MTELVRFIYILNLSLGNAKKFPKTDVFPAMKWGGGVDILFYFHFTMTFLNK